MKFYSLTKDPYDPTLLQSDYKNAREIGKLRLGSEGLYFRNGFRTCHIPYDKVRRCFRRVLLVPAKLCCGKGELHVEYLVLCDESGELASIPLPGTHAAKVLMEDLRILIPDAQFGRPDENTTERDAT